MIRISLDDEAFAALVKGGIVKHKKHWLECFPGKEKPEGIEEIEIMISLSDIGYHKMIEAISQGMKFNKIL